MNFASHTPESLLPRSDSKNPATTCKGITSNGRPCRRSLAASPRPSPTRSPPKDQGVIAVLRDGQDKESATAAFYCWQHKDQAERVAETERNHTDLFPLQERTSIDTLVDRVGVMNLEDIGQEERRHKQKKKREGSSRTRHNLPADWQRMQGPLLSVPSDMISPRTALKPQTKSRVPRSNVKASLFCCVRDTGEDDNPPPHLRPRPTHANRPAPGGNVNLTLKDSRPVVQLASSSPLPSPISRKPLSSTPDQKAAASTGLQTPSTPTRPSLAVTPKSTGSQTQGLLSFIPSCLSPQTTSLLLNELSKPISSADAGGYIYMFWLTQESHISKPDDDAVSDLLEPPRNRPARDRQPSDVLQRYASQRRGTTQNQTILLKIGRAENVHRRLSQWAKQCSHNITLVRYYPYTSSRILPSNTQTLPTKVPHVHRVERLIHVELAEKRVTEQGPCEACGREHREWFEIEATRDGLRTVDEVIRRWVSWAERHG